MARQTILPAVFLPQKQNCKWLYNSRMIKSPNYNVLISSCVRQYNINDMIISQR